MAFLLWGFVHKNDDVHVVTSHYKENLEWLKGIRWPIVLIDKQGADSTCFTPETVIPNQGREASSYLKYIIDHYDSLPKWVAFIHGHETAWHQMRPYHMLDMINHAELNEDMFESFNGHFTIVPSSSEQHEVIQVQKHWDLVQHVLGDLEPNNDGMTDAGAQFIVSRDRILRHTKETYQGWYDALMSESAAQPSDIIIGDRCTVEYELSVFFEYTWHAIFGEPWNMKPRAFPIHKKYRIREYIPDPSTVKVQPMIVRARDDLVDKLKNLSLE